MKTYPRVYVKNSEGINLQIIQYKKYERLSGKNSIRSIEVKAPRGIIYDRHGIPLVDNLPTYNLEIIPFDIIDLINFISFIYNASVLARTSSS